MGRSGTPTPSSIIQTLFFFLFFLFLFLLKSRLKGQCFPPSPPELCSVWQRVLSSLMAPPWLLTVQWAGESQDWEAAPYTDAAAGRRCYKLQKRGRSCSHSLSLGRQQRCPGPSVATFPQALFPAKPPWGQCPCITHLCCNECARQDQGNAVNAEGWASRTAAGRPTAQPSQGLILWSSSCRCSSCS